MLPLPNEQIQVLNLPKALKKDDSKTFKHSLNSRTVLNLRKGATKNWPKCLLCHSLQRVAPINTNEDGTMLVVYVCMAHVSCFQSLWYNIYGQRYQGCFCFSMFWCYLICRTASDILRHIPK